MKNTKYIITGIIFLIVCLSIVQITVSNILSTDGITLNNFTSQIDALKKENAVLREEVYTASSLTTISNDAGKLGFVEAKTPIVIANSLPLAIKQ
ncbi:MAG: hypothetical protein ACREGI_03830 [Candidatus Levyibacteriota bacterium]